MKTTATILSLLACAAANCAFAQPDEPPTARVSYDDLDLSGPHGRAVLQHRVDRAVDQVCLGRPQPMELERQAAYQACKAEATADAQEQLAQLFAEHQLADAQVIVRDPSR